MNENQFETELIQYITSGTITKPEHLEGIIGKERKRTLDIRKGA